MTQISKLKWMLLAVAVASGCALDAPAVSATAQAVASDLGEQLPNDICDADLLAELGLLCGSAATYAACLGLIEDNDLSLEDVLAELGLLDLPPPAPPPPAPPLPPAAPVPAPPPSPVPASAP